MYEAKEYKTRCPICKDPMLVPIWKYCNSCEKEVSWARGNKRSKDLKKKEKALNILSKIN